MQRAQGVSPVSLEACTVAGDRNELERAHAWIERLVQTAPHGLAVVRGGLFEQVNPALCAITRSSPEELLGRPLNQLVPARLRPALDQHLAEAATGPAVPVEREWDLALADGSQVHATVSTVPLDPAPGSGSTSELPAVLVTVVDTSQQHRHELALAHLASHDPLTGLANRSSFDRALENHLEQCRRYGPRGALLMLDLDDFKHVNDTLGHGAGDQVIVSLAEILTERLRATDTIARLGGDEFAILLPEADRHAAEIVAHGLVDAVSERVHTVGGTRRRVTTSVGVVLVEQSDVTAEELLSAADLTMYDAKEAGRNGFVVLDSMRLGSTRTGESLTWAGRIRDALERDRFRLHAQPIMDLRTGRVTGAEVLVRMVADDGTLVPPAMFLPVAERTGLIAELDRWVVERAVDVLAATQRLDPLFRVEVNLSGHSVGDPAIEAVLARRIAATGVDPSGLVLEITETAAVSNMDQARSFAERLSAMGCRFALDDFGAGFGSFYYLKHLIFDYVKIDGEFVANCPDNPTDRLILASIVDIARGLGKETIAEFVADESILEVVLARGVDHAQGYHVGRPLPVPDLLALIAARPDEVPPTPQLVSQREPTSAAPTC